MNTFNYIRLAVAALISVFGPVSTWANQINLQSYNGQWVCAEGGGGGLVSAIGGAPSTWETFTLNDLNGGALESGDMISIQASNGQYFCAENGGGDVVVANRDAAYGWEMFWIHKLNGGGSIASGDSVAIQGCNGQWVCAEGGGGQALYVNRDGIGGWEAFTITMGGGGGPNSTPSASITPSVTAITTGQTIYFTVSGSCDAGLNEIGLELCDGAGNPIANMGAIGVGGTSASYAFPWTGSSPGTYVFDGYAWNVDRSALARTGTVTVTVTVTNGVSTTPSATISPSSSSVMVGQTVQFTITGSCDAGLNEIGLEQCDGAGNPYANLGAIGVGGTSASNVFSWQAPAAGTYYFDGYAWNYNRSELARTNVVSVTVGAVPPAADSITNSGSPTANATFEVYANNVRGVTNVMFPTWTDANGQDDIQWYSGEYDAANNRWKRSIRRSDHNNESGNYAIHVYGVSADGNWAFLGATNVTLTVVPPLPPPSTAYDLLYEYNTRNAPTAIKRADGSVVATYSYDVSGQRASRISTNGTRSDYAYDQGGRLNSLYTYRAGDGAGILNQRFGHDTRDRRTWQLRDNVYGDTYRYQADSELIEFRHQVYRPDENFGNAAVRTDGFAYDASGNRTSRNEGGAVTDYQTDALNQYTAVSGATISHSDGRGNITQWQDWTYTYDADNRLIYAGRPGYQVWFYYDPMGRLAKLNRNGQWEFRSYDAHQVVVTTRGDGTMQDQTIWGPTPDEVVARWSSTHGWLYHHQDPINSTVAVTDQAGNVSERYLYDAYGQEDIRDPSGNARVTSVIGNPWMFTGQELMPDLGLSNYKNRFYHPDLGRFIQNDPIRFDAGDLNLYRYCFNNPVNLTDPDGQIVFLVPVAIFVGKMVVSYAADKALDYARDNLVAAENRETFDKVRNVVDTAKAASGDVRSIAKTLSKHSGDAARLGAKAAAKSGGRKGSPDVRTQNQRIGEANEAAGKGTHTGGGDLPETHFPPPGGGTKGGRFGDVTNTDASRKRHVTQTVDTRANGEPTPREIDAALDIYDRLKPGETLTLTPKR